MRQRRVGIMMLMALAAGGLAACDDTAGVQTTPPSFPPPDGVRTRAFAVTGVQAPPNPVFDADTPPALAQTRIVETRAATGVSPRVVLLGVPGIYSDANSFHHLGRQLVRRDPGVAVWGVTRRSNQLEDTTGLDYIATTGDLDGGLAYYFDGAALDGRRFDGFLTSRQARYLSEWGVGVHFGDLTRVIRAAKERYPDAAVVWMGHSLGSIWGQMYAHYDPDCDPATPEVGHALLDGFVLLDGAADSDGLDAQVTSREQYLQGPIGAFGVSLDGVEALRRQGDLLTELGVPALFLGVTLAGAAQATAPQREISGMLAERVFWVDLFLTSVFGFVPRATPAALLGLALDDDYQPLAFARVRMGRLQGPDAVRLPPLEGFGLGARPLFGPTARERLYTWDRGREHQPPSQPALTRVTEVVEALLAGPDNFIEWYFPLRILLDTAVVGPQAVAPGPADRWPWAFGLCLRDPAPIDVPVFALSAEYGVAQTSTAYQPWLDANSVADRTLLHVRHNHLDMLLATDARRNPLIPKLATWLDSRF